MAILTTLSGNRPEARQGLDERASTH